MSSVCSQEETVCIMLASFANRFPVKGIQRHGVFVTLLFVGLSIVEHVWNMMAHAQKPDLVFQRNGRVHLNGREGGGSVQSTTGSRGVRISGSDAGYTMFWGSVKGTGYPLQLPVSPSLPLPCITMCHHISTEFYCFRCFTHIVTAIEFFCLHMKVMKILLLLSCKWCFV